MELSEFLSAVRERKAQIGMLDTAATVEDMRNKGAGRTRAKRELLRRIAIRSNAAALPPTLTSYVGED